ncbi:MAG: hypothetical protein WCT32_04425 [Patescibacteria group bacterium]|jgi:hypothetical protein
MRTLFHVVLLSLASYTVSFASVEAERVVPPGRDFVSVPYHEGKLEDPFELSGLVMVGEAKKVL